MNRLEVFLQGKWFVEWFDEDDCEWKVSIIPLWLAIVGDFLGWSRIIAPWKIKIIAPWKIKITD